MRLRLSQDPFGSAGQRATVRSEQSLATHETSRDKRSDRLSSTSSSQECDEHKLHC